MQALQINWNESKSLLHLHINTQNAPKPNEQRKDSLGRNINRSQISDSERSTAEKIYELYFKLFSSKRAKDFSFKTTYKSLGTLLGCSSKTIGRRVEKLVKLGFLEAKTRISKEGNRILIFLNKEFVRFKKTVQDRTKEALENARKFAEKLQKKTEQFKTPEQIQREEEAKRRLEIYSQQVYNEKYIKTDQRTNETNSFNIIFSKFFKKNE